MSADSGPQGARSAFAHALECYRQGTFEQADAALNRLLSLDPDHFDALHLQGLVASRLGHPARAVELIRRAVARNGRMAAPHRHLGNALRELGRLEDALASYTIAIRLRADFKEAYVNRGTTLLALRRPLAALADFDAAITLGADDAAVHTCRASALIDLNRTGEAHQACAHALAVDPDFVDALVNRAVAWYLQGDYAAAIDACDRAILRNADHPAAHAQRGAALQALRQIGPALASVERAIELDADNALAHHVRALCWLDRQRPELALECCERAIARRPELADAHNTRGLALVDLLRLPEALASFGQAVSLSPEAGEPRFNEGVARLLHGDFERGWELYEHRPLTVRGVRDATRAPLWDGRAPLAGRTLLAHAEQGLGDTIQFCRYAPVLNSLGARVILAVQPELRSLMRSLEGVEVVGIDELPTADYQCPLLSLPRLLRTRLATIPAKVPYLSPDPERVSAWRSRLGTHGRLIGIRWQGSTGRADAGRSFPLMHFAPLAAIPGVRLISLQKGAGSEQLADVPSLRVEDLGSEFEPGGEAFLDVAAVMANLDLVITSDTSIAHLAGALARPTWVALKLVPDWRWLLERESSPWYPTLRLFRQRRRGDWEDVFDRMRGELMQGGM